MSESESHLFPAVFWALRGGGAGGWGVIIDATLSTLPILNATIHTVNVLTATLDQTVSFSNSKNISSVFGVLVARGAFHFRDVIWSYPRLTIRAGQVAANFHINSAVNPAWRSGRLGKDPCEHSP
jgi:hypothetical protein